PSVKRSMGMRTLGSNRRETRLGSWSSPSAVRHHFEEEIWEIALRTVGRVNPVRLASRVGENIFSGSTFRSIRIAIHNILADGSSSRSTNSFAGTIDSVIVKHRPLLINFSILEVEPSQG